MFDHIEIHYIRNGGAPKGVLSYRWIGILEHEVALFKHFRLYWKQSDRVVARYDGITGHPTFQTFADSKATLLELNLSVVIYRAYEEPGQESKHDTPSKCR